MKRLQIGGSLGHVEEFITGYLLVLWQAPFCNWKPIRNCTGRYSCKEGRSQSQNKMNDSVSGNTDEPIPSELSPVDLMRLALGAGSETVATDEKHFSSPSWKVQEFGPAPGRNDCIQVLPLDPENTTGIISYVKRDEQRSQPVRYVHTLNAPSGFQRKLEAVGIQLL